MVSLSRTAFILAVLFVSQAVTIAQNRITTPKEEFGFNLGDDYHLANYRQLSTYWRKLARESNRIVVKSIGRTAEGREQLMCIVTAPENHKKLARYQEISQRLARAEGLNDETARALAREGKAVVWIDGGLHATETLGAQQLGEMIYQMVSRNDEETLRILKDVIILFVHANPDGNDLVADWYMRNPKPAERMLSGLPRLYQKYIGHDNNRDSFASTQPETENMNRVLYREWFPQILYNHHQSGPAGTVLWSPPMRDPFNYNQDPLVVLGISALGNAMHTRLAAEGKPGATMKTGGSYDGWWNGGLRSTAAFHNIIALLTETIGSPTPMRIPLVMQRQLPFSDLAYPIAPQPWHFRQSIEYSLTCNRAVLDYAARMRENLLFNIYRMGKNSIERGSHDNWTVSPKRLAALSAKIARENGGETRGLSPAREQAYWAELRTSELRDPRAFIIPSNQPDFATATKFINALLENGIRVHRATHEFQVQSKTYPAGSYVVFAAQPFRPHVLDMFEPQDHPDVFAYPGAPPTPPYDNAGWSLALQMGVEFDRILEGFAGPFEKITDWNLQPLPGRVLAVNGVQGYLVNRQVNNSFTALNRLLKAGAAAYWLQSALSANGKSYLAGTLYLKAQSITLGKLATIAAELGVNFEATTAVPGNDALKLIQSRIGLWDRYGGSMPAGWTRWVLEQFEFPFERVFAPALDAGDLNRRFDTLIFVDGAIPAVGNRAASGADDTVIPRLPTEYTGQPGRVTAEKTLPQLRRFVEAGGTIIAIGDSAANLAAHLNLPIQNHLAEKGAPLPRTKFYSPGSLHTARVATAHPIGHGLNEQTIFFFDNSPVFKLGPDAEAQGLKSLAWYDSKTPLRSGWAWGQELLANGIIAIEAKVGQGKVLLFGPEILQRAQPHGTFKLLFNSIHYSTAEQRR
jgi:hypothetical protein